MKDYENILDFDWIGSKPTRRESQVKMVFEFSYDVNIYKVLKKALAGEWCLSVRCWSLVVGYLSETFHMVLPN